MKLKLTILALLVSTITYGQGNRLYGTGDTSTRTPKEIPLGTGLVDPVNHIKVTQGQVVGPIITGSGISYAGSLDSSKYWHKKYDSAAYKVIFAREVLNNIQDYLNLCKKNPKLNKFDAGWVQRALTDYYYKSGTTSGSRKKVIHKPVTKGAIKK